MPPRDTARGARAVHRAERAVHRRRGAVRAGPDWTEPWPASTTAWCRTCTCWARRSAAAWCRCQPCSPTRTCSARAAPRPARVHLRRQPAACAVGPGGGRDAGPPVKIPGAGPGCSANSCANGWTGCSWHGLTGVRCPRAVGRHRPWTRRWGTGREVCERLLAHGVLAKDTPGRRSGWARRCHRAGRADWGGRRPSAHRLKELAIG